MDSMAEYLNSMFDDFTLQARVLPALILLLPYILILGYTVEYINTTVNTTFILVVFLVLVGMLSKLVREAGYGYAN